MTRNILIVIAVIIFTSGLTYWMDYSSGPPKQGSAEQAPDFFFTDTKKRYESLRSFEGKVVLLNFWASWCPPCIKEFPILLDIAEQYPDNVVFIALSSDLTEDKMHWFLKKLKDTQPNMKNENVYIGFDEDQDITQTIYKSLKLPETFIIAPDQTIAQKFIGADWDTDEMINIIDKLTE